MPYAIFQKKMGAEGGLVPHGLDVFNHIAEIKLSDMVLSADIDKIEDIECPWASVGFGWIEVIIGSVQPILSAVHYCDSDKFAVQRVSYLK